MIVKQQQVEELKVLTIPMPSMESVMALVLCNTGSRYEAPQTWGVAHYFEHLVFKGTTKYPTALDLSSTIDAIGADFNAFTGKEYTGYYVHAAQRHMPLALDVLGEMIFQPLLRDEDIDRERTVIIEELNMYADQPAAHVANQFEQMIYANTGIGHDILGTKETLHLMDRTKLLALLEKWYHPSNLVLVLAGAVDKLEGDQLSEVVTKHFLRSPLQARQPAPDRNQFLGATLSPAQKLSIIERPTEQAHFILAWPGLDRFDDDKYALELLSTIIGGNMSSRLFTEVREKRGLGYYIHSDADYFLDTGIFGASGGVDPQRIEEALEVTITQFTDLVSGKNQAKITQKDLRKAKDYNLGKLLIGLESTRGRAQYAGLKYLLEDTLVDLEEVKTSLEQVTLDDLQRVVEKCLVPGELRLAVIGPYANQATFDRFVTG